MLSKKQLEIVDWSSRFASIGNVAGFVTGGAIVQNAPSIALGGWLLIGFCLIGTVGSVVVGQMCDQALGKPI